MGKKSREKKARHLFEQQDTAGGQKIDVVGKDRTLRVRTGAALLVLSALFSSCIVLKQTHETPRENNWIGAYEKRFEGVKKALPPRGMVSYMTDAKIGDIRFAGNETAKYYLTQYTLSPVIVEYGINQRLIIGNFSNLAGISNILQDKGLRLVKDFGGGLILLEKGK